MASLVASASAAQLFRVSGERVLITGASAGLGRSMAIALAQNGASVAVCARRQDLLDELCEEVLTNTQH